MAKKARATKRTKKSRQTRRQIKTQKNRKIFRKTKGGDSAQGAMCGNLVDITPELRTEYTNAVNPIKLRQNNRNLRPLNLPSDLDNAVCSIRQFLKLSPTPRNVDVKDIAETLIKTLQDYHPGKILGTTQFDFEKYKQNILTNAW
jgi:hypothetical protein